MGQLHWLLFIFLQNVKEVVEIVGFRVQNKRELKQEYGQEGLQKGAL